MSQHPLLDGMNPQQIEAITADLGPVLVLAGPGSGKTSVLTRRIAWLIQEHHVPHYRIMAVTFTNKAAGEMRSRVEALLGDRLRGLQVSTFHSACARFLRRDAEALGYRRDWVIYDTDDQRALMKVVLKLLDLSADRTSVSQMLNRISRAKCEMKLPQDLPAYTEHERLLQMVYEAYQTALAKANAMDFDDLLLNMARLLKQSPDLRAQYQARFEHVLVDEFQDTNTVQYELVKLFAAPQDMLFVVGDEDQSIYAFRGADYRNLRRFRSQYANSQQILLEQNYRSTQYILDLARTVIDRNPNRTPKALHSDLGAGERIVLEELPSRELQADYVLEQMRRLRQNAGLDYKDFAIMYRSNWLSLSIEQMLVRERIPYVMVGGVGFYKRREVKEMLAYLRLAQNPDDRSSFDRIVNTPRRGIGDKSVAAFHAWAALESMTLGEALERIRELEAAALPTAARRRLRAFATLWAGWRERAASGELVKLLDRIYAETDYEQHLRKISDSEEEFDERQANVREILRMLERAEELDQSLAEFLVEQSLYSDVDDLEEGDDRVTLTTLHSAKGLEYRAVFIVNINEGVLPNHRSLNEPGGLEEERRLLYVGLTRAERYLLLNFCFSEGLPSRFLYNLPWDIIQARPVVVNMLTRIERLEEGSRAAPERHRIFYQPAPARAKQPVASANPAIRARFAPFSAPEEPGLRVGARARHKEFGEGKVIGMDPGGDIVSMSFDEHKLKKVFAEDLTPLD